VTAAGTLLNREEHDGHEGRAFMRVFMNRISSWSS